jgi:N-glycosidase YbiA
VVTQLCNDLRMADVINFYRVNDPYGCFSNFSPHPVFIGTMWPTNEHYFQAQKFLGQPEPYMAILMDPSPMNAARIGRDRHWNLRPDWEDVKVDIMRTALGAKVTQHAVVRETLLSTGNATIVEHTVNDSYWADGGDGTGLNMLGLLLMEIRDTLTADGPFDELRDPLPPPWLKYPDIGRYSIGWRMGSGEDYIGTWGSWFCGLSREGQRRYQETFQPAGEWVGYWEDDD